MTYKFKGNIVRKGDFHLVKTLLYNRPRIGLVAAVIFLCKRRQWMGHNYEVERLFLTNGDNLLKLTQRSAVLTKIVTELIPDKNELNIILVNDINNPFAQRICRKIESCYSFLCGKAKDIVHQRGNVATLFQSVDNLIRRGLREGGPPLGLLKQSVHKLIMNRILQPCDNTFL